MSTATQTVSAGLDRIGRVILTRSPAPDVSDTSLLTRFISAADPDAFAQLVARHGPMVYAVCHRGTRDPHLADDAFQATFLVFLRRAIAVRPRAAVRGWLYGVAVRTAQEARTRLERRRKRETPVSSIPERPTAAPSAVEPDDLQILDEEIARLPDRLRAAVVLCELDGVSRRTAAAQLGVAEGTLSSRLATARKLLAARLRGRGVVMPAAGLGIAFGQTATKAVVPPGVADATVRLATAGVVRSSVAELSRGIFRAMLLGKLRGPALGGFFLVGCVLAAGFAASPTPAAACHRPGRVVSRPTVVLGLAPPVPSEPHPPNVVEPERPGPDAKLAAHLTAWEKQRQGVTSVHAKFEFTRQDVNQKKQNYKGSILHKNPDLTRLRIDNVADESDYEAYICNKQTLYQYNGSKKTATEFRFDGKPGQGAGPGAPVARWFVGMMAGWLRSPRFDTDPPFFVLSNVSAKSLWERYAISQYKDDPNYVYLKLEPRTQEGRMGVEQMRLALRGPSTPTPYTPALLWYRRPDGQSELWKFEDVRWNVPGLNDTIFRYEQIPGWQLKKVPAPE